MECIICGMCVHAEKERPGYLFGWRGVVLIVRGVKKFVEVCPACQQKALQAFFDGNPKRATGVESHLNCIIEMCKLTLLCEGSCDSCVAFGRFLVPSGCVLRRIRDLAEAIKYTL
tara:strand:+ start:2049 stop:2393 length:345 start_codon:yes stop_codon:yes gene_type:complete